MHFVLAQAPKYGPCSTDTFPYQGMVKIQNVTAPIVQVATRPGLKVSGYIQVVDGCHFFLRDFVFYGADESYWNGGFKGSTDSMLLSSSVVVASAFPQDFEYSFVQTPGAEASYNGFNQFRLYSKHIQLIVATADLPTVTVEPSGKQALKNVAAVPSKPSIDTSLFFVTLIVAVLAFF
ncbi:hypothetical protein EDD86DRAFT_196734 [Gorgonomyces haynaldii]|nr:hypothetical protein EDD86DRAFT_196734 [Gorgonomyces haynaldii]